jgi:hypothetical protein
VTSSPWPGTSDDLPQGAVRALLGELIDDAGLFPPAQLGMADALAAHARGEASAHFWMLGRFVVPASRLAELLEALDHAPDPLPLSLIVDGNPAEDLAAIAAAMRAHGGRIAVETVEGKASLDELARAYDAAGFVERPDLYVEVALDDPIALEASLLGLSRARAGNRPEACAKIRCGGLSAEAVPAPAIIARFMGLARELDVPFKATAGLHHPIRGHNDAAGFTMHGFLNVAGAAVLGWTHRLDALSLETILADEDAGHFHLTAQRFAWRSLAADPDQIGVARGFALRSYGSCSFDEPVDDLVALGMLDRAPA